MVSVNCLCRVDECSNYTDRMRLRGWCFVRGSRIVSLRVVFSACSRRFPLRSFGLASPDVAAAVSPEAGNVRFDEWIDLPDEQRGHDFTLEFQLADGRTGETGSVHQNCRDGDRAHACWYAFLDLLRTFPAGDVLEIGSRARSGVVRRELVPATLNYVGLDVMAGRNVDVVGDAHELSRLFAARRFTAVFSLAVFEHIAMPWKVALEMNRVLRVGGLAFVNSQQTWPVHEEPSDFWRFSTYSWSSLFNQHTGFEILRVAHGEPARVHPLWDSAVARDMPLSPAYLSSSVIARKTSETTLEWPVPSASLPYAYPTGEQAEPPQ